MFGRLSPRSFLLLLCGVCIASLGIVYLSEYGFGIKPCTLCLYQRYIFMTIIVVSLTAFFRKKPRRGTRTFLVIGMLFALNAGIAGYQVLIEQKVLEAPSVCRTPVIKAETVDELRAQLQKAKTVPCDEVTWSLLGLSMAAYNVIWCLGLASICIAVFRRFSARRFGLK